MDLNETISQLRAERAQLEAVIAELEAFNTGNGHSPERRGRKSMGAAERREVSARMKKYWASRRKERGAA
jgi:hypothetical protein